MSASSSDPQAHDEDLYLLTLFGNPDKAKKITDTGKHRITSKTESVA